MKAKSLESILNSGHGTSFSYLTEWSTWSEILVNIGIFAAILLLGKVFFILVRLRYYYKRSKKRYISQKIKLTQSDLGAIPKEALVDTERRPLHCTRVKDRVKFVYNLAIGQHYAVRRNYVGYTLYHHFLISGIEESRVYIIHYNGEASVFLQSASKIFGHVCEEPIELTNTHYFPIPDNLFLVINPNYPEACDELQQIVHRARERIGENRYGITYNNCEHFVKWALLGEPFCEQYDQASVSEKVVAGMVDELPFIGIRMTMKICKEVLYGLTLGIEHYVLQSSARLIRHTVSVTFQCLLCTSAATLGWSTMVEAGFLALRILDWKYYTNRGTLSMRDYNNAKDKAITGSVFSLVFTTLGAIIGQLIIPLPHLGAVIGSFFGGLFGRIFGILLAGYGIAIKEKFDLDRKIGRYKLLLTRSSTRSLIRWKRRSLLAVGIIQTIKSALLSREHSSDVATEPKIKKRKRN